jgi:hypothetical protein
VPEIGRMARLFSGLSPGNFVDGWLFFPYNSLVLGNDRVAEDNVPINELPQKKARDVSRKQAQDAGLENGF